MSRRWLITVSLVAHAGIGAGMFISGLWDLDRLKGGHRGDIGLGAMINPGDMAAEGGHAAKAAEAPKIKPKQKPRKKAEDLHQIVPKDEKPTIEETKVAALDNSDGKGEGDGDGDGTKTGIGTGIGDGKDCAPGAVCTGGGGGQASVCGNSVVEVGETCDDGNRTPGDGCSATCAGEPKKTTFLPPNVFVGLRTSGDTQIHPPATVKTEMQRDGRDRVTGSVKLCLDTAGYVSSASMIGTTKYPAYDAILVARVREWRYRPYTVNGTPVPACSAVTFNYSMK